MPSDAPDHTIRGFSGAGTANGAKVIQWSANGGGEQGRQFVARVIDA